MALFTVKRHSTSESCHSSSESEGDLEEGKEEIGNLPCVLSPARSSSSKSHRQGSVSEHFFALKGAALILPRQSCVASNNLQLVKKFGGELQIHLHAIFHHLRPQDNIKLAVRLESWDPNHRRYLVIISTNGRQDTEESIVVGCDFETKESTTCNIGLVLPIWRDTRIRLDGDGGFHVECHESLHTFKPVSVQAMWSALQSLHRCADTALRNNYYEGSLFLTWIGFYASKVSSDRMHIHEWLYREHLSDARKEFFEKHDPKRQPVEKLIRTKLQQVMMHMDLDNCTSRQIRCALENVIDMDLCDYKTYIDTEMLTVLGQMDCASKILDYLYLGSEWNACNLEELEEFGITHILNVTIEIDNFFPDNFRYKTIQLYDVEESDLLPHWNHTWKFISEAKKAGGKCLVHCRMGISRSSATVCAYLMKEKQWNKNQALDYVKSCRPIICPNAAFQRQLDEYEGILFASAQRHNKLFRSRSESSISESNANDETPAAILSPRGPTSNISFPEDGGFGPMEIEDFDFNRHLLDIAMVSEPKFQITRPKSWSPEESRAYYKNLNVNQGFLASESLNDNEAFHRHYLRHQNFSEPVELLAISDIDPNRSFKIQELRRNFANKRAHLRKQSKSIKPIQNNEIILEDLAQSEDSVFVHDGTRPYPQVKVISNVPKRKQSQMIRSSSPTGNARPNVLTVQDSPLHTSMTSQMSSPSYQNAKNIDISLIKSKLLEPATDSESPYLGDIESCNVSDEETESGVLIPKIKTTIPVREIVAVIESPSEDASRLLKLASRANLQEVDTPSPFVKGHYKSASLPPSNVDLPQPQFDHSPEAEKDAVSMSRSYSEAQVSSVKKIVTEIESRYTSETTLEEKPTQGGELRRCMSLPSGRRKAASPPTLVCGFVPISESPMDAQEDDLSNQSPADNADSVFYIGDIDTESSCLPAELPSTNTNNSNNCSTEVVATIPLFLPSTMQQNTYNTSSSPKSDISLPSTIADEDKKKDRVCHLSPEILHVIREVGIQLMSGSDNGSLSSESPRLNDGFPNVQQNITETERTIRAPVKRRGIVRQMAREIEKGVRKLTGKTQKPRTKISRPKDLTTLCNKDTSMPNAAINKLLMGEVQLSNDQSLQSRSPSPFTSSTMGIPEIHVRSPDTRVRELVDKFDSSSESSPSSSPTKKFPSEIFLRDSSPEPTFVTSREGTKDITSLVTPPPYRPPGSSKFSSSFQAISRFQLGSNSPKVRRSHSEKMSGRPHVSKRVSVFRSFRLTEKHRSPLNRTFSADTNSTPPLFFLSKKLRAAEKPSSPTQTFHCEDTDFETSPKSSSPCPVRDMVRNIETAHYSSSSVQRAASMPSSSPSRAASSSKEQPPMKALRKTKSTPLLGVIRPAHSTKDAILRKDKTKRNSK